MPPLRGFAGEGEIFTPPPPIRKCYLCRHNGPPGGYCYVVPDHPANVSTMWRVCRGKWFSQREGST